MTIPLRVTPFGLEQRGVYLQQDRHDEYYEQLLSPRHCRSTRGDCCCISVLLLGDQNAGKSALLYSLVASKDPRYTALTSLLPIIQAEFLNRREVLPGVWTAAALAAAADEGRGSTATAESDSGGVGTDLRGKHRQEQLDKRILEHRGTYEASVRTAATTAAAAAAAAAEAVESLVNRSRDEFPFLDSDVARSGALLSAEDFAFFCSEFGLRTQQQQHSLWKNVNDSRYVLLHLLEFGGDNLDRMHAFYNIYDSCRSSSNSSSTISSQTCCGRCSFSSSCSKCDQATAAALLRWERDSKNEDTISKTCSNSERKALETEATKGRESRDETLMAAAAQDDISETRSTVLAQSLRRSFKLAAEVPLLVYFVNCSTMFVSPSTQNVAASAVATATVELSATAFLKLLLRLHACCSLLEPNETRKRPIHFVCSRISCQLAVSAGVDAAATDAAAAISATGCCCKGFDERESFRKAVEALREFISMTSPATAAKSDISKTATGDGVGSAEKHIAAVTSSLKQPFESLYCRFLSDTGSCGDSTSSSSSQDNGSSSSTSDISWVPFEDCWGVSECTRLKAEDEQLQQCASVVFLKKLLSFVWVICAPLPFCRSLNFRGVSAVRVLERNSNSQQKQHLPPQQQQQQQQQQHEAWGPDFQLCVVSIIAFLARVLSLLAEAEEAAEDGTEAAVSSGIGEERLEHPIISKRMLPGMDSGDEGTIYAESRGVREVEEEAEKQQQQQLQQEQDIMTGETGRQLISLFSACAHSRRQQQQQTPPNEVSVDLWLSNIDWREFISDFDPFEQQLQRQQDPECRNEQQKQITLSATGEVVTASAVGEDYLLLLPAAAAAAAFTPLASGLVSLGCCLPCCADGGPWGPLVVQFSINMQSIGSHIDLLLLPQILEKPITAIQQQLQQVHLPPLPLNQKELLKKGFLHCLAAVQLPFHPQVCGLFDSILTSCAREPLPADFWTAGAAAAVAAVTAPASEGAAEADTQLAAARKAVAAAVDAAAGNAQALLQQRLQQELLQAEKTGEKAVGATALVNSLQLLLHLCGDVVLLQQMAAAAARSTNGSEQNEHKQQKQEKSSPGEDWRHRTGGPYCSQNQLFWTVALHPPAEKTAKSDAVEAGGCAAAARDCCGEHTPNSDILALSLQSINRELAAVGLMMLPGRQAGATVPPS
ncbi:hypothetical protein, conserved [Eimeria brunetti]|uniref:Uncharacterized protein n=1 Tax=Eimeria brunetti TaxID=51314 RepID=U6LSW8_9EIME|nr:hypothetical protein, conserved [Eimeria brunetti]